MKYQSHQHSSSYFGSKGEDLCKISIYATLFISYHCGSVLTSTITTTWQILRGIIVTMPMYMYTSYCDKKRLFRETMCFFSIKMVLFLIFLGSEKVYVRIKNVYLEIQMC